MLLVLLDPVAVLFSRDNNGRRYVGSSLAALLRVSNSIRCRSAVATRSHGRTYQPGRYRSVCSANASSLCISSWKSDDEDEDDASTLDELNSADGDDADT